MKYSHKFHEIFSSNTITIDYFLPYLVDVYIQTAKTVHTAKTTQTAHTCNNT